MKRALSIRTPALTPSLYTVSNRHPPNVLFTTTYLCSTVPTFATSREGMTRYSTNTTTRQDSLKGHKASANGENEGSTLEANRLRTEELKTESTTDATCNALFAENPNTTMVFGPPDRTSNLRQRRYRTLDEKTALPEVRKLHFISVFVAWKWKNKGLGLQRSTFLSLLSLGSCLETNQGGGRQI